MASVVVIYALRQMISATAIKAYGLLVSFGVVASMVSVGNVIQNFLAVGFSGAGRFVIYALLHTAGLVQLLSFAIFLFALLLARDIIRSTVATPVLA